MSAIKKGVKKIGKFVKKHWKTIALVAAGVFTAGIATVGVAGFTGAMSAAGGGLTGFLSATGSTLWAGATSIAGTLGIGSGAQGTAAAYGAAAGHGGTLTTGALAQSLGFTSAGISPQAQQAAKTALDSGSGWRTALEASQAATTASQAASQGLMTATQSAAPSAVQSAAPTAMQQSAQAAGSQIPQVVIESNAPSLGQTIAQAAIPAAFQMGGAYLQAQGMAEAQEPNQMWGVDLETGESYGPQPLMMQPPPDDRVYQPRQPRSPRPIQRRPM